MRRKIIKQGNNSYTLTLPIKWIRQLNLDKESELEIEESQHKLTLTPSGKQKRIEKATEFHFTKKEFNIPGLKHRHVQRVIAAAYKAGFDSIKITTDHPPVLDYIEKRINYFMGIEVVDRGENYCLIKNLVAGLDEEFDTVFRRAFLITNRIGKESLELIKRNKHKELTNLNSLEQTNNKITDFCKKLLAVKDYKEPKKTKYIYALTAENERLVDEFKYIFDYLAENKIHLTKNTVKLYELITKEIENFNSGFYKFSMEQVYELSKNREEINTLAKQLFFKVDNKEKLVIHHLMNFSVKIYEMGEAYLEMILSDKS
ncbi:hypothetical protein HOB85_01490 [Candidatus Woesearchaeota archaeon]|nr:hypothetical protein [Candidatus Woesearchaeota archaeon]